MRRLLMAGGVLLLAGGIVAQEPAKACPDLSGTYAATGEDGGAHFTIRQTRCERIDLVWEINNLHGDSHDSHRLILDGQFRADSGWFGDRERQRTAARFRGRTLEVTMKSAKQPPTWMMGMFLQRLPNHDMCIADFKEANEPLPEEGDLWGNEKNGLAPKEEPCRFSIAR